MNATLIAERPAPVRPRGRWITDWDPEDEAFWAGAGHRIARRNLVYSILVEHVGFSIWLLWSAVAASLPAAGFPFSVDQLFWLVAVPNLVGSFMRMPYTVAVARFGGRNWTTVSGALLLVPVALMAYCVTHPATPYWMFLMAAATAGFGGGNFASAMANISYFYPERHAFSATVRRTADCAVRVRFRLSVHGERVSIRSWFLVADAAAVVCTDVARFDTRRHGLTRCGRVGARCPFLGTHVPTLAKGEP